MLRLSQLANSTESGQASTWEEIIESSLSSKEDRHLSSPKRGEVRISELLKATIEEENSSRLNVKIGEEEVDVPRPRDLMTVILEVLTDVARGHSVSVGPEEEELTASPARGCA